MGSTQSALANLPVYLAIVYMWWFITTPSLAPKLEFLGQISFEKWLAGSFIIVAAINGQLKALVRPVPLLVAVLFAWMVLSWTCSEYNGLESAVHWQDYYWKQLVCFACLTVSLQNERQFKIMIVGVAGVILFYQVHSWWDFLNGGSFVYQQGMKRMKGVWGEGGYGAGNAWGFLGLFGIPISIACYRLSVNQLHKWVAIGFLVSTSFCIVFSGARGSLVAAVVYLLFVFRWQILKMKYVALVLAIVLVGVPLLPEGVRHRFLSLVSHVDEEKATASDRIAAESAQGRMQGLIDGFKLANESPILGCGPSVSAQAAFGMRQRSSDQKENDQPTQLHNLYGQIAGELGYVGLAVWTLLVCTCVFECRRARKKVDGTQKWSSPAIIIGDLIMGLVGILMIYGCAGHILYDYRWLFTFAMANSFSVSMADQKYNDLPNSQADGGLQVVKVTNQ